MSVLLPQFKCMPDSFSVHFKTHQHHTKSIDPIHLRAQCTASTSTITVLDVEKLQLSSLEGHSSSVSSSRGKWSTRTGTTATTTTVLDLEKLQLPSLESRSNFVDVDRPWTYSGTVAQPNEANIDVTFTKEKLLTNDDAVIAAAAAEALALATAAVKSAKNAASMMVSHHTTAKYDLNLTFNKSIKRPQLENPIGDSINVGPTRKELEDIELSKNIAIKSRRQMERKARRSKAADKAAAGVVSIKSTCSSSRRKAAAQVVDHSDPLRFMRGTTGGSGLLTAAEERKLSEGIQQLLELERLHNKLTERCGCEPTLLQWANAAGIDKKMLRQQLTHGVFCKDKMIKSNIRLVMSIAKNYQGAGMNLQDLVQEGCRGLIIGAERFDPSKGFRFSTYATWWIKQAVRKFLTDQSRIVRLPLHMVEASYKVREARKKFQSENGRQPSDKEIVAATGLTMTRFKTLLSTPTYTQSLDQKIGINCDLNPLEILVDPEAETPDEYLTKQLLRADLEKVMDTLSERGRLVIRGRFGLDDGRMKTLQEIGDRMGLCRERVRQIEKVAMRKLKNKKKLKNLSQYFSVS